jgi:hypothetical protein
MTTKIDISSLDAATKSKIEQYHKRCCELDDVVKKPVTLNYEVGVVWNDVEPESAEVYLESDLWFQVEKAHKEFLAEIKEETKEIIRFSEEVAAKLGVDKDDLWDQYFLP